MIKSVLFDLDGTLLDRDTSIKQFIWAQYDRLIDRLSHIPKSDYIALCRVGRGCHHPRNPPKNVA